MPLAPDKHRHGVERALHLELAEGRCAEVGTALGLDLGGGKEGMWQSGRIVHVALLCFLFFDL